MTGYVVKEMADSFHVAVRPARRFKESLHYLGTYAYLEDGRAIPFRAGLQRRGGRVLVESVWVPKSDDVDAAMDAACVAQVLVEQFEGGWDGGVITPHDVDLSMEVFRGGAA